MLLGTRFAVLNLAILLSLPCAAESPFIPGFDRFGRHGELSSAVSGQLLLTELSCTACHVSKDAGLQAKRGPVLTGVGNRLQTTWVESLLLDPQRSKPGTTMPAILADLPESERTRAALALSAYLASLTQPFPEIKGSGLNPVPFEFWNRGDTQHGRELFHQVGCVACHNPDETYEVVKVQPSPLDQLLEELDPEELAEMGLSSAARRVKSVPFPQFDQKYTRESLTHFLLNPHGVRPSGRMPDFQLRAVDAADIAAFLLGGKAPQSEPVPKDAALVNEGQKLFIERRCINCHDIPGLNSKPAKSLAELDPSHQWCDANAPQGQPLYELDEQQRIALLAAVSGLVVESPLKQSLLQLNCLACHERDKAGGVGRFRKPYFETVGNIDIGDEGRLPPALTGVGRKLNQKSLTDVLTGKSRIRPHMTIQMPLFPAAMMKSLPAAFAAADGTGKLRVEEDVFDLGKQAELRQAGRQLMDFGCVQCHAFNGEALPGTVGVDLVGITSRVQPEWFHEFLLNPASLKDRTRMPTFFPDGRSASQQVLAGNVEQQIAAMWAYLKDLEHQPLPAKIEQARSQDYELKPVDRPVVLRTFMPVAGTRAIAVGFPQQLHFAFDAEHCHLAQSWRGRFLDAEGTWFIRFTPPANPLGMDIAPLPAGPMLTPLLDKNASWPEVSTVQPVFRGYRLDSAGVPTFLYQMAGCHVIDRIEPGQDQSLMRHLTIQRHEALPQQIWLLALRGQKLTANSNGGYTSEMGLAVQPVVGQPLPDSELLTGQSSQEWRIPIVFPAGADRIQLELQYQWPSDATKR